MILENKCDNDETMSSKRRIKSLNKIETLYDKIGHETSLHQHMIRSTKVRWLTYEDDINYCELWDKKEEYLNRNSRSTEKKADKIRALRHGEFRRP